MTPAARLRARLLRAFAARRKTLALMAMYFILYLALRWTSGDHGLVTPEGHIDLAFGTLVAATLALRVVVLFALVPSLAYSLLAIAIDTRRSQ
jgi:hypothetical protein